jgi:hypothetical protein
MKQEYKVIPILITSFSLSIFFISCWCDCHTYNCCDPVTEKDDYFKIKVDNASFLRDSVNTVDTLQIAFWGTIGNDSCYFFSSFQATKSTHQTDLILWGVHKEINSYGQVKTCKDTTKLLNGMTYNIYPLSQGNYSVVIHQPDGSQLVKIAYVR